MTTTRSATETSAGLMRLAADGDELAFAGIVDAHDADMSSVCFMVTGGDVEITDPLRYVGGFDTTKLAFSASRTNGHEPYL